MQSNASPRTGVLEDLTASVESLSTPTHAGSDVWTAEGDVLRDLLSHY